MIPLQFQVIHQKGQALCIQLPTEIESGEYEVVLVMQRKTMILDEMVGDVPKESKIPAEDQHFLANELKQLSPTGIDPFEDFLKI